MKTGRKRRITTSQLSKLRKWKPLKELAKELGLSARTASWARSYHFKQEAP